MSGGSLLEVRALRLVRGERRVLDGVNLTVRRGGICALMGLSGSGKTTILRAAVALEAFDGGTIAIRKRLATCRDCQLNVKQRHQRVRLEPNRRNILYLFATVSY